MGFEERAPPRCGLAGVTAAGAARGSERGLAAALLRLELRARLWLVGRRMRAAARDPMKLQRGVLEDILRRNRDTVFGRRHGFADIVDYADYVRRVPVREFEGLRSWIEADMDSERRVLTAERPAQYVRTGGSSGRPRDIPMTSSHLRALRRIQRASFAFQYRACPQAFAGSILALASPAVEGHLPNGMAFGALSGLLAGGTPRLARSQWVLPREVLALEDSRVKHLLALRLAIACPDVTCLASANPDTLLTLASLYREHQDALIADLRSGGFFLSGCVPAETLQSLRGRLAPRPARAEALVRLRSASRPARLADLFGRLRAVVTWTCAGAGVAARALRFELAPGTRILDLGYLSSGFRGTLALGRRPGSALPTLDTHFFEFVERGRWERKEPVYLTLDQLEKGADYYVIVTTPSGLYRYFINELVRVSGRLHRAPLLRFLQKGSGVTSITGEKLCEWQVLEAVAAGVSRCGCDARFVLMLADEAARRYRLYVEPVAAPPCEAQRLALHVEEKLRQLNPGYRASRTGERLAPLAAAWLRAHAGDSYGAHRVVRGQREGRFQSGALGYARQCDFPLDAWVEGTRP
ncbi:MAG: GH3 auxin-responsive promoter family protein [Burkholderiales bacterium]|nr:GH3 auxin-responsive promoter family protein [Burkholderiales bacterium]